MRPITPSIVLVLATAAILAGCAAAPGPTPRSSVPDRSSGPSAPIPTPSANASAGPVATWSPTPRPTAATDEPTAAPSTARLSAAERRLVEALRADVRPGCAPRRSNLPSDATAGIECKVGSSMVDRVGAYGFGPTPGSAAMPGAPAR